MFLSKVIFLFRINITNKAACLFSPCNVCCPIFNFFVIIHAFYHINERGPMQFNTRFLRRLLLGLKFVHTYIFQRLIFFGIYIINKAACSS